MKGHDMETALDWLKTQPGGLATYRALYFRMMACVASEPESAAAARLVAFLLAKFIDDVDRDLLPAVIDNAVRNTLLLYLEKIVRVENAEAHQKLALLNELGAVELVREYT